MADHGIEAGIGVADDLSTGRQVGPGQQADKRPVLPRDERVEQDRRGRGDRVGAQCADLHEGAGHQLELLGDTAGKNQTLRRVLRVDEGTGVADAIKALVVESRAGQFRLVEVARRDMDAAQPQLIGRPRGHHLQLDARKRQADQADALGVPISAGRGRRGLGRTPTGVEDDALAGGSNGQGLHPLVQVVGQPRPAIGHQAKVLEEALAQRFVGLERCSQCGITCRCIGVISRRDLTQIAQGFVELARRRPAVVDVERATFGQQRIEQGVAAHRVVPGHPVKVDRVQAVGMMANLRAHRHVGAHHLLRVDDGLGHAGRPRGEQQLACRLGSDAIDGRVDLGRHRRRQQRCKTDAGDALGRPVDMHDGAAVEVQGLQRFLEHRPVLHHHHRRLDQAEEVFQLRMVLAHQRVGRRDRRHRQAGLHRRLRHQRVFDRIARQDCHRAARCQPKIEQTLGQRIDAALGLAIRQLAPLAVRAFALRQPGCVGPLERPFGERCRDVFFVRFERIARLQNDHTVVAAIDLDVARQPVHLAKCRRAGGVATHVIAL